MQIGLIVHVRKIRFQTDYRLWVWTALALFFSSWFFPIIIDKAGGTPVERIRWLFNYAAYGNTTFDHIMAVVLGQAILSIIVSVIFAWMIQVAIVIAKTTKPEAFNRITRNQALYLYGIVIAILMAIFPPWTDTYIAAAPSQYWQDLQSSIGYSFVLTPEKPFDNSHVIAIDFARLAGQWIGLVLIMGCLWFYRQPNRRLLLITSSTFICILIALVIIGYHRTPYANSKQLVNGHDSEILQKMGGTQTSDGTWIFPTTNNPQNQTN
ncbi:MAG TPA: hypothetical protein VKU37_01400 [Verrucomicrobiae bacterium]|jgi:hypothetical protein|nr:hypothetical protein [Verrucomicrobiae bacterium]